MTSPSTTPAAVREQAGADDESDGNVESLARVRRVSQLPDEALMAPWEIEEAALATYAEEWLIDAAPADAELRRRMAL